MGDHKPGSKSVRRKKDGRQGKDSIHEDTAKPQHPTPQFLEIMKGLDISKFFLQLIFPSWHFLSKKDEVIQKVKIAKKEIIYKHSVFLMSLNLKSSMNQPLHSFWSQCKLISSQEWRMEEK